MIWGIIQNNEEEIKDIWSDISGFLNLDRTQLLDIIEILWVLIIILLLWILWGFLLGRIRNNITPELYNALRTLGRAVIFLLGLFWVADEQFFIGTAALLGTAIGFASSTTIGNFISGLYLLITNPFSVGDYIILPSLNVEGVVEEVSINYTNILTPQGVHAKISNQKLLGTDIHNTRIIVPIEVTKKRNITWKDNEEDKFDSYEDVIDVFKGLRARFANKEKEFFLYPLVYTITPDTCSHTVTKKVFDEAVKKFSGLKITADDLTWVMNDRSTYQINLIVSNPYTIFQLKTTILGYLEEKMEELQKV